MGGGTDNFFFGGGQGDSLSDEESDECRILVGLASDFLLVEDLLFLDATPAVVAATSLNRGERQTEEVVVRMLGGVAGGGVVIVEQL